MDAEIVLLPGDGIGPEVLREARLTMEHVARRYHHRFRFRVEAIGGAALDRGLPPLPDETLAACRRADAVLLGAVGGPKWDGRPTGDRPEDGLLGLRRSLEVFANLRPVKVDSSLVDGCPLKPEVIEGTDLLFVRELTGGLYFGDKTRNRLSSGIVQATDLCRYDTAEIARVARQAGRLAHGRRGKVTSVDKANVLETSRLWRETVTSIFRDEFPTIQLEHLLVDACAMHLIRNPRQFDVILTENLFGDILTDEASMLAGTIGVLPSASIGEGRGPGLFEPIHGSAPDLAGKNVANPYGAISSVALLLREGLGLEEEAGAVEAAVRWGWAQGLRTADMPGGGQASTDAIGRAIGERIESQ